jgi:prepilin-type N-terminal cleavage/methylation domain-containing protein
MEARRFRGDEGYSLLEILIAIAILGLAASAVLGAMAMSISSSRLHQHQATVQAVLVSAAENLKGATHVPCASDTSPPAAYTSALTTGLPSGWDASDIEITSIKYWGTFQSDGSLTFGSVCHDHSAEDPHHLLTPQQITISATDPSSEVTRTLTLVKS